MRIVNVWGTYIDLDHVLGIEAKPTIYYSVPPVEPVILTLHLAFRSQPFLIMREFLPDEMEMRPYVVSRDPETTAPRYSSEQVPHYPLGGRYEGTWVNHNMEIKDRKRTLVYLRASEALGLLRELWGGRGNIDIPTIPRDTIPS